MPGSVRPSVQVRYYVRQGERVRLSYTNNAQMWHPMHLHGHAFALLDGTGPRKDTVIVLPRETVTVQLDATDPVPPEYSIG